MIDFLNDRSRLDLLVIFTDKLSQECYINIDLVLKLARIYSKVKIWNYALKYWLECEQSTFIFTLKTSSLRLKEECYKNIACAYGNLFHFDRAIFYSHAYLYFQKAKYENFYTASKLNLAIDQSRRQKIGLVFDDDSTLISLIPIYTVLRKMSKVNLRFLFVKKGTGQISVRQLSLTKHLDTIEIDLSIWSDIEKLSKLLCEFSHLATCKGNLTQQLYLLGVKNRPKIISFYMGLDFFPASGVFNRVFAADTICFNSHTDKKVYEALVPEEVKSEIESYVLSPKFMDLEYPSFPKDPDIETIYFLAQAIVPTSLEERKRLFLILKALADKYPDKSFCYKT